MRFNRSSLHSNAPRYSTGCEVKFAPTSTISIGVLTFLQLDREGRRDFVHEGELEGLLAFAQDHRGLLLRVDRHHGPLAAFDLQGRIAR